MWKVIPIAFFTGVAAGFAAAFITDRVTVCAPSRDADLEPARLYPFRQIMDDDRLEIARASHPSGWQRSTFDRFGAV